MVAMTSSTADLASTKQRPDSVPLAAANASPQNMSVRSSGRSSSAKRTTLPTPSPLTPILLMLEMLARGEPLTVRKGMAASVCGLA